LRGYIQRRGRLVGDQQLWLGDHGHGDHGALAHAAGHLERVAAKGALRVDKADAVELVEHAALGFGRTDVAVQAQDLGDLRAQPVQGRQRPHGFLKDHCDPVTANFA